jgi:hypothetical protein
MRIPPKGRGSSCCSSGILGEKMAWPEGLWVVMRWDMVVGIGLGGGGVFGVADEFG